MNLDRIQQRLEHIEELREDLRAAALRREEQRVEMEGLERESHGRREEIRSQSREQIQLLRRLRQELAAAETERTELAQQKEELESYLKEAKEDVVSPSLQRNSTLQRQDRARVGVSGFGVDARAAPRRGRGVRSNRRGTGCAARFSSVAVASGASRCRA